MMNPDELAILLSILANHNEYSWDEIRRLLTTLHDETEFDE